MNLIIHSFYFLAIYLDIFIDKIIFTMPTFITQVQRFFHNNFDHHCIYYTYLTTFIQQNLYIILLFDIIFNILYINIHTHIEYSINNIEKSKTLCSTVILDLNNTIDISYNRVSTSECYDHHL